MSNNNLKLWAYGCLISLFPFALIILNEVTLYPCHFIFEHEGYLWEYSPSSKTISLPNTGSKVHLNDWLNNFNSDPILPTYFSLIDILHALKPPINATLNKFVKLVQTYLLCSSIFILCIASFTLLLVLPILKQFKLFILSLQLYTLAVGLWLLSHPPLPQLIRTFKAYSFDSFEIKCLIFSILITGLIILFFIIKNSLIPSLLSTFKSYFAPRRDDNEKRYQLDVHSLNINYVPPRFDFLIPKYVDKGYFVLGTDSSKHDKLKKSQRPVLLSENDLNNHLLVLGPTGSGKTSTINLTLIYQAILKKLPVIIASWKHDWSLIKSIAKLCEENNNEFKLVTMKHGTPADRIGAYKWTSLSYNPLANGDSISLRDRIMTGLDLDQDGPAAYYSTRQRLALKVILDSFLVTDLEPSISRIIECLDDNSLMSSLLDDWNTSYKEDCENLSSKLKDIQSFKQFSCANSDIELIKAIYSDSVIYFDFDSQAAPKYGYQLGKMFIAHLQYISSNRYHDDKPLLIILDEYQQVVCPAIAQLVVQARSANFNLVLSNQSLRQLVSAEVGGDSLFHTVWSSAKTKIIFNVPDPDDADFIAKATGTEIYKSYQNRVDLGSDNNSLAASIEKPAGRVLINNKPLIPANVLLYLPPFAAVKLQRGLKPNLISCGHIFSKEEADFIDSLPPPLMAGNLDNQNDDPAFNLFLQKQPDINNNEDILG